MNLGKYMELIEWFTYVIKVNSFNFFWTGKFPGHLLISRLYLETS